MKNILLAAITSLFFTGCKKTPNIGADYLSGGVLFDSSVYDPQNYLLSTSNPNPTTAEAQKPVIIASHGYTASTFEWSEFRAWSAGRTDYYISRVLLAGHGTRYANFKKSNLARLAVVHRD